MKVKLGNRELTLGNPAGQSVEAKVNWLMQAMRQIERASRETDELPDEFPPESHTHQLSEITDHGEMAAQDAGSVTITGGEIAGLSPPLPIASGGTGQATAADAFDALKQQATTTYMGAARLATDAETDAGVEGTVAVTPLSLASVGFIREINSKTGTDGAIELDDEDIGAEPYGRYRKMNNYSSSTTLGLSDLGALVRAMSGGITFTVAAQASVDWPSLARIDLHKHASSGVLTIAEGSGVTIRSPDNMRDIVDQFGGAMLVRLATDIWWLEGRLA